MAELVPDAQPDPGRLPGRPTGPYVARREIRVSDGERQLVVDELRIHYGAGRLDMSEFEERVRSALAARVRGDLHPLLDDLPDLGPPASAGPPVRPRPARKRPVLDSPAFRIHFYVWLAFSVFLVLIWLGTGGDGGFWPVFPISATGLPLAIHAAVRKGAAPPEADPGR